LVMPGTLVSYAYRVRIPPGTDPGAWSTGLRAAFPESGWRLRNFANAAPTLRRLLDRVGLFLTLVGLTALVVGGVGVGNAVASYLANRTLSIAILKSVGASGRLIFQTYLTQIAVLAALGISIGLALGAIVPLLAGHFLTAAWPLPMRLGLYPLPLAIAAAAGVLTTVAFSLGPLTRAKAVPPATLFRAAVEPPPTPKRGALLLAQCASGLLLAGLAIVSSSDRRLAIGAVLSALAALAAFRLAGLLAVALVRRAPRARQPALRIAFTNLGRRGANTASVIASLGLGLTVLVALSLVQGNISLTLDRELPERAPSFFFIDVQPDETAAFDKLIQGFPDTTGFERVPSLRGRIARLNGVPVEQAKVAGDAQWAVRSERGLTYAATLPAGSHLVEGQWWPRDYKGPPLVSFDADLARGMGLRLGDTLTVNVLGRDITATIANLRAIDWTSLGINFAMVFSPGTFAGAPETSIAMVRLPPEREANLQKAVTDQFPNISSIPVKDALKSVSDIVSAVALALQATAAVALGAAALVLAGALAAARRRRLYESVVLKVLGATRTDLLKSFLWEYGLLGLLAAAIASVLGTIAAYLVLTQVMRAEWVFLPETALLSAGVGLLLTLSLGYAGTWRALGTSAAPYLRNE
jgi:putative ABC transport system permease protein